jgi:hypothetical protein
MCNSEAEKWQDNLVPFHQLFFIVLTVKLASLTRKKQDEHTQKGESWDYYFFSLL